MQRIGGVLSLPPAEVDLEGDLPALRRRFSLGQEALQHREFGEASRVFSDVFAEAGWPEAAYNASVAYYLQGNYGLAEAFAAKAASGLPRNPSAGLLYGVLLNALGRHRDAVDVLERSIELEAVGQELGLDAGLSRVNLASSLALLGETGRARIMAEEGLAIGKTLRNKSVQGSALEALGHLARLLGEEDEAKRRFGEARSLGAGVQQGAALESLLERLEQAMAANQYEKADRLLSRVKAELSGLEDPLRFGSISLAAAGFAQDLGDRIGAESLLGMARERFDVGGLVVGMADCEVLEARWALEDGKLDEALRRAQAAYKSQEGLQIPLARASTLLLISEVLANLDRFSEGLDYLTMADKALDSLGISPLRVQFHLVYADLALRQGMPELGLEQARAAEAAAVRLGRKAAESEARVEVAIALAATDQLQELRQLLKSEGLPLFEGVRSRMRVRLLLEWARAELRVGQEDVAIARSKEALGFVDKLPDGVDRKALEVAVCSVKAAALARVGRSDEAEQLLRKRGLDSGPLKVEFRDSQHRRKYNEGIRAFEAKDFENAIASWQGLLAEEGLSPERFEVTRRNLQAALLRSGRALIGSGKLENAQRRFREALKLSDERKDALGGAWLRIELAQIRAQVQDPDGAYLQASEAAVQAEGAGEVSVAAQAWILAGQFRAESDVVEAQEAFSRAFALLADVPSYLGKRATLGYNLAVLAHQQGQSEDASRWHQEAMVLARDAGLPDLIEKLEDLKDQWERHDDD